VNAPLFVLLSDGQAWTGQVQESLSRTRARGVPVFVIGVGTQAGGIIPDPKNEGLPAIVSMLDRGSLTAIAGATGGRYLELDRGSDQDLANQIIDAARRRTTGVAPEPRLEDLYWQFLLAAAGLAGVAVLFTRDRSAAALHLAAGAISLAALATILR
jgi:Ca-activated chloride channel family protein